MRFEHENSDAFADNDENQLLLTYPDHALAFPDKLWVVRSKHNPIGCVNNSACTDAAASISSTAATTRRSLMVWRVESRMLSNTPFSVAEHRCVPLLPCR